VQCGQRHLRARRIPRGVPDVIDRVQLHNNSHATAKYDVRKAVGLRLRLSSAKDDDAPATRCGAAQARLLQPLRHVCSGSIV
jgi:hypothetical protein